MMAICALVGKTALASSDNARATADFLNIGVGARAAGLGGAFTPVADDATAAYWNPGGLASIENPQLIFSHFAWYQDITYEYLAIVWPVSDRLSVSASSSYLNYGTIEGYDIYDNPTGEVGSTYDLAAGLSAGYNLTEDFSLGVTGKYVALSLDNIKAGALAADFGARYRLDRFIFGIAVANLGQDLKFSQAEEKLPTCLRAGVSTVQFGSSLLASLEIENQFYGGLSIRNGYEWNYRKRYFLRAGLNIHPDQEGREIGKDLAFGAGAIFGPAQFDYTFSPQEGYTPESIHRFSVILNLR
jgi:hypothetical protein